MTVYPNPGAIGDMPPTPNKVESSWGNAVRDRVVQHFAATTDRDAAIPAPVEGQFCYVDALHQLQQYCGATDGWQMPWYSKWGVVGEADNSGADQGSITATSLVTGCSVTWTAVANRRYRITVFALVKNTAAGNGMQINTVDGSSAVKRLAQVHSGAVSSSDLIAYSYVEKGISAGSQTRKLQAVAGAGTMTVVGVTAGGACSILVEDDGPNGAPS